MEYLYLFSFGKKTHNMYLIQYMSECECVFVCHVEAFLHEYF